MKIEAIKIATQTRKVNILTDDGQKITLQRFGKDIYSGQEFPNGASKQDKTYLSIKRKCEQSDYFFNKTGNTYPTAFDIADLKQHLKIFIGKNLRKI